MLVLTRKMGEEILLDNGRIKFKILYERNGTVAIGINAPSSVDIDRKEFILKKRRQEKQLLKKQMAAALEKELWL